MKIFNFKTYLLTYLFCILILAISWGADLQKKDSKSETLTTDTSTISFNRDIRPILSDKCYYCHGPDVENNKAGLRLDIRDIAIKSGALVPGNAEASEMVYRVKTDDRDEIMPPPKAHKALTEKEKKLIEQWVNEGATYDLHWSYKKVEKTAYDSIDRIVLQELQGRDLSFSQPAQKEILLRRVYFDITGLPPTVGETQRFLSDTSPDAYEKLVDRLLDSHHFGENMAVYWLDAVRYADSTGYHGDQTYDVSPFRDYVIQAFNQNKPYDVFVTEQIAGDLLPEAGLEQKIASSYNRLNQISKEGGIQDKEYLKKYQAERVRTTATTFLGSTLACAECHDHKFDPFTIKDFYSFAAFFSDILEKGAWNRTGKYQEPVAPFVERMRLVLPNESGKVGFGPMLEVPNKFFLSDTARYEAELQLRLAKLLQGTPESHHEFGAWLKGQKELHKKGIQREYLLPEMGKDRRLSLTVKDLPIEYIDQYSFELFRNKRGTRSTLVLLFTFKDAEYLFRWGTELQDEEKNGRIVINEENLPGRGKWKRMHIDASKLGKHRYILPESITAISTKDNNKNDAIKVRRFAFETERWVVPIGKLNQHSITILEDYMHDRLKDEDHLKKLQLSYFSKHADSKSQVKLRGAHAAMEEYVHGKRFTHLTVSAKPREVKVLPRGDWTDNSGEVVLPATPSFLEYRVSSIEDNRLTRLDLAKWITSKDNPLTARTFVNRLWGQFFGTPLSSAPEDLGLQGEYPIYPELLNHLAYEFMDTGWNIKQMVKKIALSQTYRQSSYANAKLKELDPYNRLLARQSPRRLKAESIRDNALAVSDLLMRRIGGESGKPYQPEGYYQHLNFPKRTYVPSNNENQYRRGVYTHWQRTFLHPMLVAFDAPSREECVVRRSQSNTPLQALNLLNDPSFIEASRALAHGLIAEKSSDLQHLKTAFQKVLMRSPSEVELKLLSDFLLRERKRFKADPNTAKAFLSIGSFDAPSKRKKIIELAAWTSVSRAILNLNETITIY